MTLEPAVFRPLGPSFKMSLGQRGEMMAWGYLARAGFTLIEKNYRSRLGEIDIIAEKQKRLYFIEVKTRSGADKGRPEEAVTAAKQKQMARLAAAYLQSQRKSGCAVSFAVISILWQPSAAPEIRLIEDAFVLEEGFFA